MELTNTKFNTTKKFVMYNREKDKQFLKNLATVGVLLVLGFLSLKKAVG